MINLKPCPLCGNTDISYTNILDDKKLDKWWYECSICLCSSGFGRYSADEAANDWNSRPIEDALQARIAELEAENATLSLLNSQSADLMLKSQERIHELEAENAKQKEELDFFERHLQMPNAKNYQTLTGQIEKLERALENAIANCVDDSLCPCDAILDNCMDNGCDCHACWREYLMMDVEDENLPKM